MLVSYWNDHYYSPQYELIYNGRLIEPGEPFRLGGLFPNDEAMKRTSMAVQVRPRMMGVDHCDICGKYFISRAYGQVHYYLRLHQENGCNRTKENQILYGQEAEEKFKRSGARLVTRI